MSKLVSSSVIGAVLIGTATVALAGPSAGEKAYAEARRQHSIFQASARSRQFRHHWLRVIGYFRDAAQTYPTMPKADDAWYMVGSLSYDLYGISYLHSDLDEAIKAFRKLTDDHPSSSLADDALFYMGKAYALQKKDQRAYDAFKAVAEKYPRGDMRAKAQRELATLEPPRTPPSVAPVTTANAPHTTHAETGHGNPLSAIKYWSNPDYTRIAIYVEEEVVFKHAKLAADREKGKPPRIYIDLLGARIGEQFIAANPKMGDGYEVPIGDGLLSRARAGQNAPDRVRVVLDLESLQDYQIIPLSDPFRLVVDIYGEGGNKALTVAERPTTPDAIPGAAPPVVAQEQTPAVDAAATPRLQPPPPGAEEVAHRIEKLIKTDQKKLADQLGLKVQTVVVDAGHGGHDTGAIGPGGIREKDVTLAIAKLVKEELEGQGFNVLMTRTGDTYPSLEERTALANQKGADLFVSIHCNASANKGAHGIETYFLDSARDSHAAALAARENAMTTKKVSDLDQILQGLIRNAFIGMSADLAASVQQGIVADVKKQNKKVVNRGVRTAPFYVLLTANMPSVLVETSFITHPKEAKLLGAADYQKKLASGISGGIRHYLDARGPAISQAVGGAQ